MATRIKDALQGIGSFLLGFAILTGVLFLGVMLVKGAVWLSVRVYPFLVWLTAVALFIVLFVLLPLAIFRRTRAFAGAGIFISSYVFGITLWVWSLLVSYSLWGVTGIVVGLILGGVGVVPIAILASLFHGMWSMAGQILLVTAITIGTRFAGIFITMKAEQRAESVETAIEV